MHQASSRDPAIAAAGDVELASRAAEGEVAAFEAIIRRHNRLLFRTVRSILRTDAESEEVVQETYLKAWRALPSYRAQAKLSTWLVRIAMNEAFARVRRKTAEVVPLFATGAEPPRQEDAMAHAREGLVHRDAHEPGGQLGLRPV
ncbi:MAG: sigma-70 family RNA polymerase sigma factor, partial [Comamonadaceae bacterium]